MTPDAAVGAAPQPAGPDPEPCYEESIAFLRRWTTRWWLLSGIDPESRAIETRCFRPGEEAECRMWLEQLGSTRNIYFSVNPPRERTNRKATKADIARVEWLHLDVDPRVGVELKTEQERILRLLSEPPEGIPKPTVIISSGGGYQAFWKLAETIELNSPTDVAVAESYNLHLEQALGGDRCHNIDRIMRLPGTLNRPDERKRQKGRTLVRATLFAWSDAPGLRRAELPQPAVAVQPERALLAASSEQVPGEALTADLPDDLPELCLAVMQAGHDPDDPKRFQSRSEALFYVCCELVRRVCDDDTIMAVITNPAFGISASVLDKGRLAIRYGRRQIKRARAGVSQERLVLDKKAPVDSARAFRARRMQHLLHYNGDWLHHEGSHYADVEDGAIRSGLYRFLNTALQWEEEPPHSPFRPNKRVVDEVRDALAAATHASADRLNPPCWLKGTGPPPREILTCSNCLLHLPSGKPLELTPRFFTRNALDIAYDAAAASPPERWSRFLQDLWQHDPETVSVLQEVIGYLAVPDTSQQKIFMLVGPPRSGKGTIARILREVVGARNTFAPTLNGLARGFALQPLIGKQLAIVSDMRLGSQTDQAAVVENLLRISGEDLVTIDRKYKDAWHGRLAVRFLIITNEVPRLSDVSGALASRIVPLAMTESFLGKEDTQLTAGLLHELPGILNWAVEGWRRLTSRGRFVVPTTAQLVVDTMNDLGSAVSVFVRELCVLDPGASVNKDVLFSAYRRWSADRGVPAGGKDKFCRDLYAATSAKTSRPHADGTRLQMLVGIGLRDDLGEVPY